MSASQSTPMGAGWVMLTKRTEDPKLAWLQIELRKKGIPSIREGKSFHGPIMKVRAEDAHLAEAILAPIDEVPDDDPRFAISPPSPLPWWWLRRCCDMAQWGPNCVCEFNTWCPEHGDRHHGTHD